MNGTNVQARVADAWVDAFTVGDADVLAGCYAPDAVIDINVPQWRFQVQGRAAARDLMDQEEFLPGRRVTHLARTLTEDGLIAEVECRASIEGEERLWRSIHLLRVEDQLVVEHVSYCSGIWDATTVARQRVEAPMVRAW